MHRILKSEPWVVCGYHLGFTLNNEALSSIPSNGLALIVGTASEGGLITP